MILNKVTFVVLFQFNNVSHWGFIGTAGNLFVENNCINPSLFSKQPDFYFILYSGELS